ncbi:hypothetical protein ACFQT0_13165 [Hymenobacter humi]|uniref:Uncharacterized protein n=1 Tax=Hymenobacter humi TaxID=1411620 RepID=A0ABW2U4A3_9BACT
MPWLYAAVACMYVVLSLRMRQLASRLYLHLHGDGFAVRTGQLGSAHHVRWADVAAVEPAGPTGCSSGASTGRSIALPSIGCTTAPPTATGCWHTPGRQ